MSKSFGFTLVELLVTVSILTILISIAIISYSSVQSGARDDKRKIDILKIQAALEQYHADLGMYPTAITFGVALTNPSGTKIYLQKIPQEEKPSPYPAYSYTKKPTTCTNTVSDPSTYCTNYCLYATVENSSNNTSASQCTAATGQYQVQAP